MEAGREPLPTFRNFLVAVVFLAPSLLCFFLRDATTGEIARLLQSSLAGRGRVSHQLRRQAALPEAFWAEEGDAGVDNHVPGEVGALHKGEEGPVGTLRDHACDFGDATEHRARWPGRIPVGSGGHPAHGTTSCDEGKTWPCRMGEVLAEGNHAHDITHYGTRAGTTTGPRAGKHICTHSLAGTHAHTYEQEYMHSHS